MTAERICAVLFDDSVPIHEKIELLANAPSAIVDEMMRVDEFATEAARRQYGSLFITCGFTTIAFPFIFTSCAKRLVDLHGRGLLVEEMLEEELLASERLQLAALLVSDRSSWNVDGTSFRNASGYRFVQYEHVLHCLTAHRAGVLFALESEPLDLQFWQLSFCKGNHVCSRGVCSQGF